ncbi:helix-turn-helix domain-containing protein [Granulibacter bethesdensis]|uniref:helix-turn-helix domain-containing protein n=1 Tax=Granulibacter bethesdensis TaxID=364410 RepID=UPI0003F1F1C1|nr:helix-turn-helix domain-containing protein [Granulibacter bethesdensis]AHJ69319.1 Hypothetical protein GbCGDNIH2_7273 [Granulibacter bethesdensis]
MMDVRPVENEADYDWALAEIEQYFNNEPAPGTPEAERFSVLAALIDHYETKVWPIESPDAVDALRERMEQAGYTQSDLARLLGSRSRASEILHRKRGLTIEQAYRLHTEWKIPAETLLRPVHLQ